MLCSGCSDYEDLWQCHTYLKHLYTSGPSTIAMLLLASCSPASGLQVLVGLQNVHFTAEHVRCRRESAFSA